MFGLGGTQSATTTTSTLTEGTDSIKYDNGGHNTIPFIDASYSFPVSNDFLIRIGGRYDLSKSKSGSINGNFTYDSGAVVLENTGSPVTNADPIDEAISLNYNFKDHHSIYLAPTFVLSNNNAAFAKVGYHKTKGTLNYNDIITCTADDLLADVDGVCVTTTGNGSKTFEGWGYGLGYIHSFGNLYLQLDAEYIDYKKKSFVNEDITYSFKPESLNASISIGYKF
jgi:hypothetical protein